MLTRGDSILSSNYESMAEQVAFLPVGTRVLTLDEPHHTWTKCSSNEWVCAQTRHHARPFPAWASVVIIFVPREA